MSRRPPFRPRTDAMCQPVRPSCEVTSVVEIHSYFGPGSSPLPGPCIMYSSSALWWSTGPAFHDDPWSNGRSTSVFAANDPVLRVGCEGKNHTHHLRRAVGIVVAPPVNLPAMTNEDSPLGRPGAFHDRHHAKSKAIHGPRHVRGNFGSSESIAVIRYNAGGAEGPRNFGVCSSITELGNGCAAQTPSTVFLGVTAGDTWSVWVWRVAEVALEFAVSWATARVSGLLFDGLKGAVVDIVAAECGPMIGKVAGAAIGKAVGALMPWLVRNTLRAGLDDHEPEVGPAGIDGFADFWDREVMD